jgi:hypothetical protein
VRVLARGEHGAWDVASSAAISASSVWSSALRDLMSAAVVVETVGDAGVAGAEVAAAGVEIEGTIALLGVRLEEGVAETCGAKFRSGEICVAFADEAGGVSACRRG